jgi:hypothetical protein
VGFENAPLAAEDNDRATHADIDADGQAKRSALQRMAKAAINADELAAKPLIEARAAA